MKPYINKVWVGGVVKTHPKIRSISEKTKLTSFMISVLEKWDSPTGERKQHRNDIPIEVLGKEAEPAFVSLSPGDWVSVDGYLRSEQFKGRTQLRIRVFNISYEGSDEQRRNVEALEKGAGFFRKAPTP